MPQPWLPGLCNNELFPTQGWHERDGMAASPRRGAAGNTWSIFQFFFDINVGSWSISEGFDMYATIYFVLERWGFRGYFKCATDIIFIHVIQRKSKQLLWDICLCILHHKMQAVLSDALMRSEQHRENYLRFLSHNELHPCFILISRGIFYMLFIQWQMEDELAITNLSLS